MVDKYGEEKIIHKTWPDKFMEEQEQMVEIVSKLGEDPEIKAIVMNQAVPGCNAAIDKLLETRDDIFIVYCIPQENPADVTARANLVLIPDELGMGPAMARQAQKLGAKTFIHYSLPRHMSQVLFFKRYELIKEECEKIGLEFVNVTAPDPMSEIGLHGAQELVLEDVPKMLDEYGKDTAIFTTNCALQVPLIKAITDNGGMYVQPCCPSPYHGFPAALGLSATTDTSIAGVIEQTRVALAEKNLLGRVSNWPLPASFMITTAGVEYAIKWINGEVQKDGIDEDVLKEVMEGYAEVSVQLTSFEDEDGTVYNNYLLFLMDHIIY